MNKWVSAALCTALVACFSNIGISTSFVASAQAAEVTAASLKTDDQKASYAIGLRYGEGFGRDLKELDLKLFYKGLQDGFNNKPPLMKPEEVVATLQALQARKIKEQREKMEKEAAKNKSDSDAFLAKNKKRKGVVTTPSGLQYEVIKQGKGPQPGLHDRVKVDYEGTLPDGTVFDSSIKRGEPVTFNVDGVIKGWTEALQMMHVGDKWKIFVPADLAYGARGAGPKIGPNQALVFDVQLLGIENKGDNKAGAEKESAK